MAKCIFETFDWFTKRFEAEPKSLMMYRHDELGAGCIRHFDRLFRRAMRPNPGVISTDRHNCEIDAAALAQVAKTIRQCSVGGENNAPSFAFEEVAVIAAASIALHARAPMFYTESVYVDPAGGSRH